MHPVFSDTPESHKWFQAISTISPEDQLKIQIPDPETWREWLMYVDVPPEDIELVIATTPPPSSDLYAILQRGAAYLTSFLGSHERPIPFASLRDFNDPANRYFYVQLLTACLPFTRAYLEQRAVPENIIRASLADIGRNVRVHRKREGVGGLGVMWWLMLHVRGMIFQLGRLQFEIQVAGDQIASSMREHGIDADAQTPVLSIHIPDFLGPMDESACEASIFQAVDFFTRYFPDWPVEFAVCSSWLLDPQLKTVLSPDKNIIRFQNRFELAEGEYNASDSVMQFVFGKHVRDVDAITPTSSLARGVLQKLKDGGEWHGRQGWFQLPEITGTTESQ